MDESDITGGVPLNPTTTTRATSPTRPEERRDVEISIETDSESVEMFIPTVVPEGTDSIVIGVSKPDEKESTVKPTEERKSDAVSEVKSTETGTTDTENNTEEEDTNSGEGFRKSSDEVGSDGYESHERYSKEVIIIELSYSKEVIMIEILLLAQLTSFECIVTNHKSRIINQTPWREPGATSSVIL